ncbi:MAG TPA: twin-arginine translocation signal domain-containing protein [Vicinamibacterales bacterium]|nr:twin-arginine translocation signal domain-containing protein [Vicinamibacterales bacterium]
MPTANTPEFDARWAAWVARGLVHEQRARRRFVKGAAVIAAVAAIVYLIVR